VHIEIFEGSYGGRHGKDGMDSVDTLYANTRNNPIEDIESHVPLRVTRYELRDNACGAGKWRGGWNSVKEVQFLTHGSLSVEGDGHSHAPWGFAGGAPGHVSSLELVSGERSVGALPSMLPTISIEKGQKVRAVGGIGGGYGNPLERAETQVLDDVLDGYLTRDEALRAFGVAITADGQVDSEATRRKRQAAR
jgi:N-methylhydantoinase B